MICPECSSANTAVLPQKTALGYLRFGCKDCGCRFNERTGTVFNFLEFPTDLVLLVVRWRLRYKLSLRDLAEMFLERGLTFTHEAVREWEERFAPLVMEALRKKRRGKSGPSWYVDETYVRVKGKWCYLYRAIDRDGDLIDCRLSETRDMNAAKAFFEQALEVAGSPPMRATTDGHDSYPRAIREELESEGKPVLHRTNPYLNNLIEQDHRGIKSRYDPMKGFGAFESAERFCRAFDELRNFYRPATTRNQIISLSDRRRIYCERTAELTKMLMAR